jgi:hypothetical protein
MKMNLLGLFTLAVMTISIIISSACQSPASSPADVKADTVSTPERQVMDSEPPGGQVDNNAEGLPSGQQDSTVSVNKDQPVIDKLEVILRSGMESTKLEIDPHDGKPQPNIEVKTLYTVEINSIARSMKGERLQYDWKATGGTLYGSGEKTTWLAPHAPIIYRITSTVTDSGGSASASVNVSVRCCY